MFFSKQKCPPEQLHRKEYRIDVVIVFSSSWAYLIVIDF